MASEQLDTIRGLKLTAKWSADDNEKKKAISELVHHGDEALPAIKEVFNVTAFEEIREACIEAIKAIGKTRKMHGKTSRTRKTTRNSRPKHSSHHKRKQNPKIKKGPR